ncbi:hypothetical protein [Paraburkholderia phytofirmans]|jgi:hypothetical protein|uniref:hypothetical protein n=1 Tax=Paraburkholderia phytofirmans TaxID=261302 RepID=UPI0038B73B7E
MDRYSKFEKQFTSRNRMYEENRYLAFDMRTNGCVRATANDTGAISPLYREAATSLPLQASTGGIQTRRTAADL